MNKTQAIQQYKELPMPKGKEKAWKYLDISHLNLESFSPTSEEISWTSLADDLKTQGIIVEFLSVAIEKYPGLFEEAKPFSLIKHYDKLMSFHAAHYNQGVFIYIPKNVQVSLPIRLIHNITKNGYCGVHTIIVAEEGAQVAVIQDMQSSSGIDALRTGVVEVHARANSNITMIGVQRWHNVIGFTTVVAQVHRDAAVNVRLAEFGGALSRTYTQLNYTGPGATTDLKGVFFANKQQQIDLTTNAHHMVEHTTGDILIKGVLDDTSHGIYRGMIKIEPQAQHTSSFLSDHSLLLSKDARSDAIPSLEIDANEVKASHGATLGKPNPEEIFYLMARGLSKKQAQKILIEGYFAPVLDNILFEDLRLEIKEIINQKMR